MDPIFEQLTETNLLGLCIYEEARNQGLEGMLGVGSVIKNRAAHPGWWGHDIKSVILAPKQFSWLLESDPEYGSAVTLANTFIEKLKTDCALRNAWWVAKGLLEVWHESGQPLLYSNVGKATNYHATSVHPPWAERMTVVKQIKDHIFYV